MDLNNFVLLLGLCVVNLWLPVSGQRFEWPASFSGSNGNGCRSPLGKIGACIPLDSCPSLQALQKDGSAFHLRFQLQLSTCNVAGGITYVCCVDESSGSKESPVGGNLFPAQGNSVPSKYATSDLGNQEKQQPNYYSQQEFGEQGAKYTVSPWKANTEPDVRPNHPLHQQAKPAQPQVRPQDEKHGAGSGRQPSALEESIERHRNIYLLPSITECGSVNDSISDGDRIIGGLKADIGAYPWMALLSFKRGQGAKTESQLACGGALISKRYVITAAHCVHKDALGPFKVDFARLGEYDILGDPDCQGAMCAPDVQDVRVEKVITHENYDKTKNLEYDIALLRLKRNVNYNNFVVPVCLPRRGAIYHNLQRSKTVTVAGWGRTHEKASEGATVLQYIILPVVDDKVCLETFQKFKGLFGGSRFCAGGEKGKDSCKGDSGGPLTDVLRETGEYEGRTVQYGIVSAGLGCAKATPGIYTNVTYFMPWILDHMEP